MPDDLSQLALRALGNPYVDAASEPLLRELTSQENLARTLEHIDAELRDLLGDAYTEEVAAGRLVGESLVVEIQRQAGMPVDPAREVWISQETGRLTHAHITDTIVENSVRSIQEEEDRRFINMVGQATRDSFENREMLNAGRERLLVDLSDQTGVPAPNITLDLGRQRDFTAGQVRVDGRVSSITVPRGTFHVPQQPDETRDYWLERMRALIAEWGEAPIRPISFEGLAEEKVPEKPLDFTPRRKVEID